MHLENIYTKTCRMNVNEKMLYIIHTHTHFYFIFWLLDHHNPPKQASSVSWMKPLFEPHLRKYRCSAKTKETRVLASRKPLSLKSLHFAGFTLKTNPAVVLIVVLYSGFIIYWSPVADFSILKYILLWLDYTDTKNIFSGENI